MKIFISSPDRGWALHFKGRLTSIVCLLLRSPFGLSTFSDFPLSTGEFWNRPLVCFSHHRMYIYSHSYVILAADLGICLTIGLLNDRKWEWAVKLRVAVSVLEGLYFENFISSPDRGWALYFKGSLTSIVCLLLRSPFGLSTFSDFPLSTGEFWNRPLVCFQHHIMYIFSHSYVVLAADLGICLTIGLLNDRKWEWAVKLRVAASVLEGLYFEKFYKLPR